MNKYYYNTSSKSINLLFEIWIPLVKIASINKQIKIKGSNDPIKTPVIKSQEEKLKYLIPLFLH